jgi:2,5-diketo-D-gluconate reductase A
VASGVPRSELFVTTKLATQDQGYTTTRTAFEASLERLGLDYVDMYMIHWPAAELGKYVDSFGALMVLHDDALIRSMGVCNFTPEHLSNVIELSYTTPAVNQIELHPLLNQAELRAFHAENGIVTEAYCPLGIGKLIDNSAVTSIASAHGRTPAQVLLRWNLQLGNVVIPRSSSPERIAQNIDVFDFELTGDEMVALDALNDGTRFRQDPETYTGT